MKPVYDVIVVGGGLVGHAIALGLRQRQASVLICDGGDRDFRASRGNFGLIWVQGKGLNNPHYSQLSTIAAAAWPKFAADLQARTAIDCGFEPSGGVHYCFNQQELEKASQTMARLQQINPAFRWESWDSQQLQRKIPAASAALAGAVYSPLDGHASPLQTLRALSTDFLARGGEYSPNTQVTNIVAEERGFRVDTPQGQRYARRIVLAAGLGNQHLAAQVGITLPIEPVRGQILVTERLAPFLPYPSSLIRQTREGSVMIGVSSEHVGYDDTTLPDVQRNIAQRVLGAFPHLADAQVVRSWGALRIMTPDGLPVYDQSPLFPNAFIATCHSGVTLAALHNQLLPDWILGNALAPLFKDFHAQRFSLLPSDHAAIQPSYHLG